MDSPVTINAFFCSGIRRIRISRYCSAIFTASSSPNETKYSHQFFHFCFSAANAAKSASCHPLTEPTRKQRLHRKKGILILLCQGSEVDHHRLHPPFRTIVPFCTFSLLIAKKIPLISNGCPAPSITGFSLLFPVRNIFSSCANEPLSFCSRTAVRRHRTPDRYAAVISEKCVTPTDGPLPAIPIHSKRSVPTCFVSGTGFA